MGSSSSSHTHTHRHAKKGERCVKRRLGEVVCEDNDCEPVGSQVAAGPLNTTSLNVVKIYTWFEISSRQGGIFGTGLWGFTRLKSWRPSYTYHGLRIGAQDGSCFLGVCSDCEIWRFVFLRKWGETARFLTTDHKKAPADRYNPCAKAVSFAYFN